MNPEERERIIANNYKVVKGLNPEKVFTFFADLAKIPRPSGSVEPVADYLEKYAEKKGMLWHRDEIGNVVITKDPDRVPEEGKPCTGVILQAHQDMVPAKDADKDHDFKTDPIEFVKGPEWLSANRTTLGADDGIGVALALAVLDDADLKHPPLQALFTVDEETDMKGAKGIDVSRLAGNTLINLDAEDLGVAYVSSAAGRSFCVELPLDRAPEGKGQLVQVRLAGLLGGHSGIEINKNRANAHVLMARFLAEAASEMSLCLHDLSGGTSPATDNAIAKESVALVSLDPREAEKLEKLAGDWDTQLKNEYRVSDPGVSLQVERLSGPAAQKPLTAPCLDRLLALLRLLPLGVWRFVQSKDLEGEAGIKYDDLLVETSCNLGIVTCKEERAVLSLLARSSTETVLDDYMARAKSLVRLAGGLLAVHNSTDGWEMPAEYSRVQTLFQAEGLTLLGVHAGLECGCLVAKFKAAGRSLDAVSVGPTLEKVHTPDERLEISTVDVMWRQLLNVLEKL